MLIPKKIHRLWLKYVVGYGKPKKYWNKRWSFELTAEKRSSQRGLELYNTIRELMDEYHCNNILEVGCGQAVLRELPNYLGLDFSLEVLKQSGLKQLIYADITKRIPLPTNSQDAVLSRFVLLHIPYSKIDRAVAEICRVASKLIIVEEPYGTPKHEQPHCWRHDLPDLLDSFGGDVVFLSDRPPLLSIDPKEVSTTLTV